MHMATRYEFEAEVTVTAMVEPEGHLDCSTDEIEDFDADTFDSYGNEVEETTRVRGVAVLDCDEDDAEGELESLLQDNLSYDGDDVEWDITDVSIISLEAEKMSLDEAQNILRRFVDEYKNDGANEEICKAIEVVLAEI
jgi:hypothetical protein